MEWSFSVFSSWSAEEELSGENCVHCNTNSHKCTTSLWICEIAFRSVGTPGLQEWWEFGQRLDRNLFSLVLNPVLNNFTGYLNFCHIKNSEWSCPICFHYTSLYISLIWFQNHPFSWAMELWSLSCFQTPLSWHFSKDQSFQSLLLFPVLWPHPFLVLACRKLNRNNPTKMINFVSDQFPHWVAEQLHKHQKGEAFRGDSE